MVRGMDKAPDSITELAEGCVHLSVLDLGFNEIGDECATVLAAALRDNKDNKIESWDLSSQKINPEIAKVLAEYISVSTAVRSLKCAATPERLLLCQRPLTTHPSLGSLAGNQLCGLDYEGNGTYTAKGITKLCDGLKVSAVTSLRCAAAL